MWMKTKNGAKFSYLKRQISKKISNRSGFSLSEVLLATLIMLFATTIITQTMSLALGQFRKTTQFSNAQLLCSAISAYVEGELSYATVTKEGSGIRSIDGATVFSSEVHNFGPDAYFTILDDDGNKIGVVNGSSNATGIIAETSTVFEKQNNGNSDNENFYKIVNTKAYIAKENDPLGLKAGMTINLEGETLLVHIWVQDRKDSNILAENNLRIVPLEIKK